MNLVTWNKTFETGITEIDDQHIKLVEMLNHLYETYIRKYNDGTIETILEGLESYAQVHFQTEERLMKIYNFENINRHMIEHKTFFRKVGEFKSRISRFDDNEMIKLINFMRDWLINHIQGSDREYISCFKEQGL